jgi:murein DD-endopeptidase MepM/ murein hydrolase activator NlpD
MQGGDNEVMNHHFPVRAQRHALDIVGMNRAGFRADGLAPAELSRYAIYGAPVHAPCAGEVLLARDGLAEQPPGPLGEAGRKTPLGNTVLIYCTSDITVVLAHLKPHSVRVAAGDRVAVGTELGAVGNSGNTTEPHLHLHAVRGKVTDPLSAVYDAEPVLLSIDGQIPVRNDRLLTPALPANGASS